MKGRAIGYQRWVNKTRFYCRDQANGGVDRDGLCTPIACLSAYHLTWGALILRGAGFPLTRLAREKGFVEALEGRNCIVMAPDHQEFRDISVEILGEKGIRVVVDRRSILSR